MIAVIFEAIPHPAGKAAYLDLAARLRPLLEEVEGFISIERFESLTVKGKILSLSFWQDEAAVARWRGNASHRTAQKQGRDHIFADYRIRVAAVMRDYGLTERRPAPVRAAHEQT
jgi:heme-degrading monooxygenase HmoA